MSRYRISVLRTSPYQIGTCRQISARSLLRRGGNGHVIIPGVFEARKQIYHHLAFSEYVCHDHKLTLLLTNYLYSYLIGTVGIDTASSSIWLSETFTRNRKRLAQAQS